MRRTLVAVALGAAMTAVAVGAEEPRFTLQVPANGIEQAAKDLGADEFAKREIASDLLWQAGAAAKDVLEQAAKSADPEVRTRAAAILTKLQFGIRPDSPPDVLALITQSRFAGSLNERREAARQLLTKGQLQSILALIHTEKSAKDRQLFASLVVPQSSRIIRPLIEKGDLDQAEDFLEQASASDIGMPQLSAFLVLTGRLDQRIAALQQRAEAQPSDEIWTHLAYLLRANGDLPAAIQAAEKTADLALRTHLLAEAQRWREAAALAEVLYQQDPANLDAAAFAATYYRLAGDSIEQERVMSMLLKAANVEWLSKVGTTPKPAAPFNAGDTLVRNLVTASRALVVNERIDESLAIMRKINPQFAHMIYWKQHRHREALELAKVTPEKTLDAEWLKELLPPPPLMPNDSNFSFTIAVQVARELQQLGRHEQVDQIWNTLCQLEPAEKDRGQRATALAQLAWHLKREDDAFREAEKAIQAKVAPVAILAVVAGKEAPLALAWHERFSLQQWDQQRALSTAVRMVAPNPRRNGPPENWRQIVQEARQSVQAMPPPSKAARLVAIGHTCKIRGDLQLARELFKEAAEAHPASSMELGDWQAAEGNWDEAAKCYAAVVKANPSNHTVRFLWGQALTALHDGEAAKKQLFLADMAVLVPEQRYSLAKAVMKPGLKEDVIRQLELVRRTALPDSRIAVTSGQEIANIVSTNEPHRSGEYWQQLLLHMLNAKAGFNQPEAYPLLSHVIHRVFARAAIDEGDATTVAKELERCEQLAPGDISTVLKLTPHLRQASMDAIADGLLEHALTTYRTVLDSFPSSTMYLNNSAWLSARTQRRLDEALSSAEKAIELAPTEAGYWDTLAEVHFQRGDREAAVAAATKCLALVPENQLFAKRLSHFQNDELKTLDETKDE